MNLIHQPNVRASKGCRRSFQLAVLVLVLACSARAAAAESIRTYPTLRLKDGRELSSVHVVNYTATDVLVRHSGGATSLRSDLLPEQVIADLHLPPPPAAQPDFATDPAFLALANKVAVDNQGAPVAATENAAAAVGGWVTLAGRVAVTPPEGPTNLLAEVEVRAYPAELLARYLVQARAKSAEVAQQLSDQASLAIREGRTAEGDALAARAAKVVANYFDFLPVAPYQAQSDAYGHFTLRHDLRDIRLVAAGRVSVPRGEWSYTWISVVPGDEAILTEANATTVLTPEANSPRFAAR